VVFFDADVSFKFLNLIIISKFYSLVYDVVRGTLQA